jgi:hypothetical protein
MEYVMKPPRGIDPKISIIQKYLTVLRREIKKLWEAGVTLAKGHYL